MRQSETLKDCFGMSALVIQECGFDIEKLESKDIDVCMHYFDKFNEADPRDRAKVVFPFSTMVMLILISKICWKIDSFLEMERWCSMNSARLRKCGIIQGEDTPSHDTFRRFMMIVDVSKIREDVCSLIETLFTKMARKSGKKFPAMKQISADGKEFCGSGRAKGTKKAQGNIATLNILDLSTGCCILDSAITKKQSEIPELQSLLGSLKLKGTVLTADALHCQRETCRKIGEGKGKYVLTAKQNQPELMEEIAARFGKASSGEIESFRMSEREIDYLPLPRGYAGVQWPGQKGYLRMMSSAGGREHGEYQYFITSLKDGRTAAEAICNRWQIEGDYHYCKDMLLSEDACSFADKSIASNMARYNSIIHALYRVVMVIGGFRSQSDARMYLAVDAEGRMPAILDMLEKKSLAEEIRKEIDRKKA